MTVIEFARLGGKARAKKLSKERLIEIARIAGRASASKRKLASKQELDQSPQNGENKV
jgi:hypothetical protein